MFQREVLAAEIRQMQNSEGRDNEQSNCQAIHIIRIYHFIKCIISIIREHLLYTRPCAKSLTHSIFINTTTLMRLLEPLPFELMRKLRQWKVKMFAPSHCASNQPSRGRISESLWLQSLCIQLLHWGSLWLSQNCQMPSPSCPRATGNF